MNEKAYVKTEDPEEEFVFSEMDNLCLKYLASVSKSTVTSPFINEKKDETELKEDFQALCNKYSGEAQVPFTPISSSPDNNKNNDLLLKLTLASLVVSCGSILLSK